MKKSNQCILKVADTMVALKHCLIFADTKSRMSLVMCSAEWLLLHEESCIRALGVFAALLPGSVMCSLQTSVGFTESLGIFI